MSRLSIYQQIKLEEEELVKHEKSILNEMYNASYISYDHLLRSMRSIFSQIALFYKRIGDALRRKHRTKDGENSTETPTVCVREKSHNIIEDFRVANKNYLKRCFLRLCKEIEPSSEVIKVVKTIIGKAFNQKNVENALYFLKCYISTKKGAAA